MTTTTSHTPEPEGLAGFEGRPTCLPGPRG